MSLALPSDSLKPTIREHYPIGIGFLFIEESCHFLKAAGDIRVLHLFLPLRNTSAIAASEFFPLQVGSGWRNDSQGIDRSPHTRNLPNGMVRKHVWIV